MTTLREELLAVIELLRMGDDACDEVATIMAMGHRPPGFSKGLEAHVREEYPLWAGVVDNLLDSVTELPRPTDTLWAGAALAAMLTEDNQEESEDDVFSAPMA